ncbi:MAG: RNA polymerase sigma factor [Acidobacteriota bacterium]|nr:RNA polymerase sigma factor [Acidobacteriota bacterium]
MFRDMTYSDAHRLDAVDASAEFVMDEETFRAFYDRNARSVWAYLVRVTGNRETADDLLQEAFYRFLRAAATHENETHRRNSLYRIATNLVRDAQRRKLTSIPEMFGGDAIERVAGADHAGATERQTDVTRAMSRLKPRERAMLWLAYAEGASHREIADVMKVAPGSIKLLLFRARRRLADLLGKRVEQ